MIVHEVQVKSPSKLGSDSFSVKFVINLRDRILKDFPNVNFCRWNVQIRIPSVWLVVIRGFAVDLLWQK